MNNLSSKMIYFDNAATTSPIPNLVVNTVKQALNKYSVNPGRAGYNSSVKCSEMIYSVRNKVSDYFNAKSSENVIFTQNCTTSINIVMQGLIKSGMHFIISSLEHNAIYRTAEALKLKGAMFDIAKVTDDNEETILNFRNLIRPSTVAIAVTHASNVTGRILPIKELGKLCKKYGIMLIVDAAQSAGILPIDMVDMNIDYLCVAAHKGLYAITGTGILIGDNKPEPLIYGGTGSMSSSANLPDFTPDKYECGTMNVAGIASIGAGIDFVKANKAYLKNEYKISEYLHNNLSKMNGIEIYSAFDDNHVPICSININDLPSETVAARLALKNIAVRAGLHCSPLAHKSINTLSRGCVRIAPSVFNTMNEAKILLKEISNIQTNG